MAWRAVRLLSLFLFTQPIPRAEDASISKGPKNFPPSIYPARITFPCLLISSANKLSASLSDSPEKVKSKNTAFGPWLFILLSSSANSERFHGHLKPALSMELLSMATITISSRPLGKSRFRVLREKKKSLKRRDGCLKRPEGWIKKL